MIPLETQETVIRKKIESNLLKTRKLKIGL